MEGPTCELELKENVASKDEAKYRTVMDPGDTSGDRETKPRKNKKKTIYVSYSFAADYSEKKFVTETVRQLKENNLAEDIWFDKDERNTDKPCWYSLRLEAAEKCRAAIVFISASYFSSRSSLIEANTLLERKRRDATSIKLYQVLYNETGSLCPELSRDLSDQVTKTVNLTMDGDKASLAEMTSLVVGGLMTELEKQASVHAPQAAFNQANVEFTGAYKKKRLSEWNGEDLQEWLCNLGVKEFYRQNLAESMLDGFLLATLEDADLLQHLGVDSRVARRKILQERLAILGKELKLEESWHFRTRGQRHRENAIYLIYDPADARLSHGLKIDLQRRNFQVLHHQKLGKSKEEFLQLNVPNMATCGFVLVLLTDNTINSPFVFHEVLFAEWLRKRLGVAVFKNTWRDIRPSLKAALGPCPCVDFETKLYDECVDVLEHHLKPKRTMPGVVLEQSYLTKMADGMKPLSQLTASAAERRVTVDDVNKVPTVFISYQWDTQAQVEDLRQMLECQGFRVWADTNSACMALSRGRSSIGVHKWSGVASAANKGDSESLPSQIQRNMRDAVTVVSCITPKYLQSESCNKDLILADSLRKPIIPVLLRFCPWPPEGASLSVRQILARQRPVDLSTDKFFTRNAHILMDRLRQVSRTG